MWRHRNVHNIYSDLTSSTVPSLTCRHLAMWSLPSLTHQPVSYLPLVPHICLSELCSIGSGNGLSPDRRQAITWTNVYLLTVRNKLQWNLNQNKKLFIHEHASEPIVCEMAAILSRGRWVICLPVCLSLGHINPATITWTTILLPYLKSQVIASHWILATCGIRNW